MRATCLRRLLTVAALVGAFVVASAAPAWAHAVLQSSNPPSGGTVDRAPAELTLTFNEPVEVSLGAIRVFNCSGGRISVGTPRHAESTSSVVAVSLPALPPSLYVVTWRVISADSHPVHSTFYFRVGVGPTNTGQCEAKTATKSSATVGVLFGITHVAIFAGLALLIGGVTFLVLIGRCTSAASRTRAIVWSGWVVTTVATVVSLMLQGPYAAGSAIGDAVKWSLVSDILDTRYGHVAELRLLFLVVALPLLIFEWRAREHRPLPAVWAGAAAIVGLALSATPGLAGHAATGDNTVSAVPIDALHVAAMRVWFGGLAGLAVSALGGGFSGGLRRALIRFSALATGCVIVLVLSGIFATWRQVGFALDGYTSTSYGNILLVKVGIVVVLVAVAIDERTVHGLRRSVGTEVLFGIAILVATALLVNAQPARSALAPRLFSTEVHAGRGDDAMLIDVTVDPARFGPNTIHIYTLRPDGSNLTIRNITASLSLPSQDIQNLPVGLRRGGPNHSLENGMPITFTGKWQLVIHVLQGEFNDTATLIDVPIR